MHQTLAKYFRTKSSSIPNFTHTINIFMNMFPNVAITVPIWSTDYNLNTEDVPMCAVFIYGGLVVI